MLLTEENLENPNEGDILQEVPSRLIDSCQPTTEDNSGISMEVTQTDMANTSSVNTELYLIKQPIGTVSKGSVYIESLLFSTYIYKHSDNTRLLSARRTLSGFNIYSIQNESQLIAHLRANIFGTRYSLENSLCIKYETSFLQRGCPRTFKIVLDNLELCNKKPYFNNDTMSYSLNFNGRITQPSVRNLQIIHPLEPTYITLTFGKEREDSYILDFSYPWSPLKAFCIALSALDHKFGCD
ncbi:tubby [Pancytospora epiphaga]|nr:tubby [Pancytospora epiphaga]